jgi:hypothetical protein
MKTVIQLDRRLRNLLHILGLSCLGGAIFLEILVFSDIVQRGYFMAVEGNTFILVLETVLTAVASVYFMYIYQKFIRSIR